MDRITDYPGVASSGGDFFREGVQLLFPVLDENLEFIADLLE
jgi:hypothetical protein